MEKVYYKYGLRPIYSEENPKDVIRFYAFQWETGEFEEDFSYRRKVNHDLAGNKKDEFLNQFVVEYVVQWGLEEKGMLIYIDAETGEVLYSISPTSWIEELEEMQGKG